MYRPKILIVEDNPKVSEVIRFTLKSEGFQPLIAEDATEASNEIKVHGPDLILLDVMLPGLDGFGFLESLRRSRATRYIPVIMLTARKVAADVKRAISLGAAGYIVKPFEKRELIRKIESALPEVFLDEKELEVDKETVNEAREFFQKEFQKGGKKAGLKMEVSADEMLTFGWASSQFSEEFLKSRLENQEITYGIDESVIKGIASGKLINTPCIFAKGDVAQHGVDERIEYEIEVMAEPRKAEDYYQIKPVQVEKGTVIGKVVPPKEGKPGKTIFGKEIAVNAPKSLKFGEAIEKDNGKLISSIKGEFVNEDVVDVVNIEEIEGDVKSDNNSRGSLWVNGNVEGITIRAGGSVKVSGGVRDATLEAGSKIWVKGTVKSSNLSAEGVIYANSIKDSSIRTTSSIIVEGGIVNSTTEYGDAKVTNGGKNIEKQEIEEVYGTKLSELKAILRHLRKSSASVRIVKAKKSLQKEVEELIETLPKKLGRLEQ